MEVSVGRFLIEYFNPLSLGKMKVGVRGTETPNPDEKEVEKTFWINIPMTG